MSDRRKQVSRLLVFAEISKQKSFTGAARTLGVSKSALSQQLRLLEEELSTQLLNRTTRGMSLTAAGQKLFVRCQMIQSQVELAFSDVAEDTHNPRGPFALTYPHSLERTVVMPALEQLCSEYRGIEPVLHVSDTYVDLVKNNIDLAIRGGVLQDSGYRSSSLGYLTEIFCATPVYLQKHRLTAERFTRSMLTDHPWISSSWQNPNISLTDVKTGQRDIVKLSPFAKTNTLPTALELALRHLGIVMLPDISVRPYLAEGQLVQIASEVTGPVWPLHTVHNYQAEKPLHVTRFHEILKHYVANMA